MYITVTLAISPPPPHTHSTTTNNKVTVSACAYCFKQSLLIFLFLILTVDHKNLSFICLWQIKQLSTLFNNHPLRLFVFLLSFSPYFVAHARFIRRRNYGGDTWITWKRVFLNISVALVNISSTRGCIFIEIMLPSIDTLQVSLSKQTRCVQWYARVTGWRNATFW